MAIPSPDSDSEGPPSRRKTRAQRSLLSDMVVLFMLLLLLLTMIRSESIRFSFASLFVQFVLKDFGFLVLVIFRRANNVGAIFLSIKILFYRGITILGHILDRSDGCPPTAQSTNFDNRRQETPSLAKQATTTQHNIDTMFTLIDNFLALHAPPWYRTPTIQTATLGVVFFWVFAAFTTLQFYAASTYGPDLAADSVSAVYFCFTVTCLVAPAVTNKFG